MANVINIFDFQTKTLDQLLATAVSDGTYGDVFTTLKADSIPVTFATGIESYAGELWSNATDDYIHASYQFFYKAPKWWRAADAAERDAYGSDKGLAVNDLAFIEDVPGFSVGVSVDGATASTWADVGGGGASGPTFDNRQSIASGDRVPAAAAAISTGSIAMGADGLFTVPADAPSGPCTALRVVSVAAASTNFDVQFYTDSARTKLCYRALQVNRAAASVYVDGTEFVLMYTGTSAAPGDLSNLEADTLYGKITNNGPASDFQIEAVIEGNP